MMGKVVNHRDAAGFAEHLLAASHAAKTRQSLFDLRARNSEFAQQHVNAERVGDIHASVDALEDFAAQRHAAMRDRETRAFGPNPDALGAELTVAQAEGEAARRALGARVQRLG